MVAVKDIGWGSYASYEGPYWRGKCHYTLPDNPTESDKRLMTITATEGGAFDAYNGYDQCICTSGLIQWCDRAPSFLVCGLLGKVAESNRVLLQQLDMLCAKYGYSFKLAPTNGYRYFSPSGVLVSTPESQQRMFFGTSSGLKGQWADADKTRAKEWAAAISSVWEQPEAQDIQRAYTEARLSWFVTKATKPLLDSAPATDVGNCFVAAYLSFAANNPAKASAAVMSALPTAGTLWTKDWLVNVLKAMTFKPGVAIYPHRYDCIRPVLEKLYNVDLPDLSSDLKSWLGDTGFKDTLSPKQLQLALLELGYDLGPCGADGQIGKLTKLALQKFEFAAGIPELFQDGTPDKFTVPALEKALSAQGKSLWDKVS
jgi:hypothetical protein